MAGSFEPRRADRGADACNDLKRGGRDRRPPTMYEPTSTNRQRSMAWDSAAVDGIPDRTFRHVGGINVHGDCPVLAAFARLCPLGSIETLPSPKTFAAHDTIGSAFSC
jgi:hypothetical protein